MPRVRGHFRNGTWVRSHYRRPSRTAGLGGVALAVAVLAAVGTLGAAGGPPTPPTTTLPTELAPSSLSAVTYAVGGLDSGRRLCLGDCELQLLTATGQRRSSKRPISRSS